MVHVTERARQELKQLLAAKVDWPGARLRLIDRGCGVLGLGVDIASPEDEVVEYDGEAIMVFGPELASSLQMITLDVDDTPDGPELVITEKAPEQPVIMGIAS
jgi:Fe-S cluster assembly iron-binding protein IscA